MYRTASAILAFAVLLGGCISQAPAGDVVVASYPAAFVTESLAGPDLEVVRIGMGSEAHHYEPSTRDLDTLRRTPYLVLWTEPLEAWVHRAQESLGAQAPTTFEALRLPPHEEPLGHDEEHDEEHEEGHDEPAGATSNDHDHALDPHTWLDPLAMAESVHAVAGFLAETFPQHASNITVRQASLESSLHDLHDAYAQTLSDCTRDRIVTNHNAYSYPARRYGFEVVSLHGIAPGSEPSPAAVDQAIREIRAHGLPILFVEEGTDPRIVDAVREETDVQVRVLATLESRPAEGDYFDVQYQNLDALSEALGC